jgi:hypothetical protein
MGLIAHILGIDNESGRWYAFWSGFGSDLGELGIVGAILASLGAWWHRHNCHVDGCRKIGRHKVEGTEWVVCQGHHPTGPPTVAHIQSRKDGE